MPVERYGRVGIATLAGERSLAMTMEKIATLAGERSLAMTMEKIATLAGERSLAMTRGVNCRQSRVEHSAVPRITCLDESCYTH